MYADHENVLILKLAQEVDGDRAVANIRQTKVNLASLFAVSWMTYYLQREYK